MRLLKRLILLSTLLLGAQIACGQSQVVWVSFQPIFNGTALNLEGEKTGSVEINVLRFYISNVRLSANETNIFSEENSYHYINFSETKSSGFQLLIPDEFAFDEIVFNIGIDSTTNVSGAMRGDLDPTKGMYWTWQNGYINFKLEGISPDCPARKNKFQFHLGGYALPYATIQEVTLDVMDKKNINIEIDLDKFLADINLAETYQVMQPNQKAVELSESLPSIFSIAK